MATSKETDLSDEEVVLTAPEVKASAPNVRDVKRGRITNTICTSAASIVLIGVMSIIPILQIIIGRRYADQCVINWHIPQYLHVAGAVGLVVAILSMIQDLLVLWAKSVSANLVTLCGLCGISISVPSLLLFLFAWLITGCVWIFGARSRVQFSDETQSNYCHPTLYRLALWSLLLSIIFQIFFCCCSCYQTKTQLGVKTHCPAERVPRSVP